MRHATKNERAYVLSIDASALHVKVTNGGNSFEWENAQGFGLLSTQYPPNLLQKNQEEVQALGWHDIDEYVKFSAPE